MHRTAHRAALLLAITGLCTLPPRAAALELKPILDIRLRYEATTTPTARSDRDRDYDFGGARARLGLDLAWPHFTLHGLAQGTALDGLPNNAAFGPGPAYVAANGGEHGPSNLAVAELSLRYHDGRNEAMVGRQRFADGVELLPGIAYLDEVQRARFGERLLGNWDWVAAGRRWDGVTAAKKTPQAHLSAFYLRPLQGGVNVEDAFDSFASLDVWGAVLTAPYGAWLPKTSFRFQAMHYDDERPAAFATAGGELALDTLVASALVGDENNSALLWIAMQGGDWGAVRQDAHAWFAGVGHRFAGVSGQPALYLGYERASSEEPGGPHQGFFNLLPTNHKFYGSIDYSAFSNLQDAYLEASWKPHTTLRLQATFHGFALVDERDAWYGGSGAFDDASLGYAARRPASGRFSSRDLGRELDLELAWTWRPGIDLRAGAARFEGSSAAREALPVAANGTWLYIEISWRR